jgi:hypothetical protein
MRFILLILALALIACQTPVQPTPNGDIIVQQIVGGNDQNPTTPNPVCLPVDRVRIVEAPSALSVGSSAAIDVTPRDSFGNIRSDNCNEKDGNSWDSDDSICSVSNSHDFKTTVRGVKAGTCELTACVTGHCDSVKFPVN